MKRKYKRWLAMLMAFILVLSPMNLAVFAELGEDETSLDMINDDWAFSAFGGNTSISSSPVRNPDPIIQNDGSVTLLASGGKVASGDEGLSFYYKEVPANANFEIHTKANVKSFNNNSNISTPNQKSFGLMLRDEVGEHGDSNVQQSDYVAVGALDVEMKGFYKQGSQSKLDPFANVNMPTAGEEYELSIRKSGDTFVVTTNGQNETVTIDQLFNDQVFVGFYVARDAEVTFSDFDVTVDSREVSSLQIDKTDMKTEYLRGEQLDLSGLKVKAIFEDDTEAELSSSYYIVTGFDSSEVGTNTITIHYNGVTTTLDLEIKVPGVTGLDIKYYPAKTVYYKGDSFDPQGFVVVVEYENGFDHKELTSGQYSFVVAGEELSEEGYTFEEAGTVEITVRSTETPETTTSFDVEVKDAEIAKLDIRQLPVKTLYFLGDELDLAGLSLYAEYSDKSAVRLLPGEYNVSVLDTTTVGEKEITLAYKGVTANFQVVVKEKELSSIEVTSYPKTTYVVGETFDSTGLEVSKVYDNLDMEVLSTDDYKIDDSEFDSSEAGTYEINIVPEDNDIKAISFQVTVREPVEPAWKKRDLDNRLLISVTMLMTKMMGL
ncbi:bacterial Ig-like domain-containing protein [Halalkalibacter flavus]|uniref:bacterial Ig-like domain-containing protein n=1 Tax=Halalkalibacter flavus TaxID=3090668 RepID=UPI002FC7DC24